MRTLDDYVFLLDYLKEQGTLKDDRPSDEIAKEFLARNGNVPRDIGA